MRNPYYIYKLLLIIRIKVKNIYSLLLLIIVFVFHLDTKAQSIQIVEGDTIVLCNPGTVTLHAVYVSIDSSQLVASNPINSIDDWCAGVVPIGFDFSYYGNVYNQCVLSTNGYITFNLSAANAYSPWPIGAGIPSAANPLNSIMGPWQDTYPGVNPTTPGFISYTTTGTAPNRIFVFNFCQVPMFSCTTIFFSGQIKLFETTNEIEFHLTDKVLCPGWNGGQAILGCQNSTGTLATVVNGYNNGVQWTSTNEAWKLTPTGTTGFSVATAPYDPIPVFTPNQLQWFYGGAPVAIGDSVVLNVTQSGYAKVTFFGCFGSNLTDSGADSIYIKVDSLGAIADRRVSSCYNIDENALFLDFDQYGPYSVVWNDSLNNVILNNPVVYDLDSLNNVAAGGYIVNVTKPNGCQYDYNFQMPQRNMVVGFNSAPNLICQTAPVTFTNTSTGFITDYWWQFGDGSDNFQINTSHNYSTADSFLATLTISNDTFDCTFIDSAWLEVHPNIIASMNVTGTNCEQSFGYFYDASFPYPVQWNWILNDSLVSIDSFSINWFDTPGIYNMKLAVSDSLCGVDTTDFQFQINPFPVVELGSDTFMCPGEAIDLDAGNPGATYSWSTGANTQTTNVTLYETTLITVEVDILGCKTTDNITVNMNCNLYFPNIFTPNRDGINDVYRPQQVNMESFEMVIYNRWGELVYQGKGNSYSTNNGWDGTYKGEQAPIGVYVYHATGTTIRGQKVEKTGNFTLAR